jgi:hypothetical protein
MAFDVPGLWLFDEAVFARTQASVAREPQLDEILRSSEISL